LRKARVAFDLFDAHELAAEHVTGQHHRAPAEPRRARGGAHTGDAAAHDHHVEFRCQYPHS